MTSPTEYRDELILDRADLQAAPTVSVVVPTRDRPELLMRAVSAALAQDYPGAIEVLVVFDQSEPTPLDVVLSGARTVVCIANDRTPGLAGARNSGIRAASGDLIAFCDDDDEWLPDKLRLQAELMRRTGAPVVSCAIAVQYADSEVVRTAATDPVTFADLLRSRVMALHPSTILADATTVRNQIGLVDEEIPASYAEDYEWLLRAAKLSPIHSVAQPLVRVYWHQASFFTNRWHNISSALEYLLGKYPEIRAEKIGFARIAGQISFACAASGRSREARRWAVRCLRNDPRQARAYLSLGVSARLFSADTVVRVAQSRGRGM